MIGKAEKEVPKIMILGGEDSPELLERLHKLDKLAIVPFADNWKDQISNKEIRAAVEIPKGFQAALAEGTAPTVNVYYYEGELKSSFGANHLQDAIKEYRDAVVKERLAAKNLPASVLTPFEIKQQNVAPPEKVGGASIGGFIGYAVILLCLTGAMYPAIDLTAGEKERGTIETILSSPVSRFDLVMGKFLLVFSASLVSAILSVTSMGISFAILGHSHLMQSSGGQSLHLSSGASLRGCCFLYGPSPGSPVFRRPDDRRSFCQNLQRGTELPDAADLSCGDPSRCLHDARRRTHYEARTDSRAEHQPGVQGNHYRHISLEFHHPDFHFHMRVCGRGDLPRGQNVSAGRCAVPVLNSILRA